MEFWGVEVKSGTPLDVKPGKGMVIHLSQASFGEVKANKNECANLFVNVDGKKMVLGTLLSDKLPQQLFDLVFDRDFELSHNLKSGSIYFFGYKAENPDQEGEEFDTDDSEEEEDLPVLPNNGKPETEAKKEKTKAAAAAAAPAAAGKQKVKIVEPPKVETPEDDDDSEDDDSDEDSDEDGTPAGDLMDEDDDESDSEDDESDSDEDEDTPKKAAPSKKRGAESEIKTPVSGKKAKLATPQKTDDKKNAHVATPHPSKQAGKTPATNKAGTPKSGGSYSCGPCNKSFGSENALQSHTKAKHSAGK